MGQGEKVQLKYHLKSIRERVSNKWVTRLKDKFVGPKLHKPKFLGSNSLFLREKEYSSFHPFFLSSKLLGSKLLGPKVSNTSGYTC